MVTAGRVGRRRPTWLRRARRALRRRLALLPERVALPVLVLVVVVFGVLAATVGSGSVPPSLVLLPVLAGGLLLRRRAIRVLLVVVAIVLAADIVVIGWSASRPLSLLNVVATAAFAVQLTRIRQRLGISGARSETILVELRDRLRRHGELPALPAGWHAELALRTAGGGTFGGDFLVASRDDEGRRLELVLVDVSGKGVDVGSRALLLSGALGGLLGAVAPDRFLGAANDYLNRQGWEEGFATAAYLAVDLGTGRYQVRSAGHPPVAHLSGGSGRWTLSPAHGPVLGVLPDADYAPDCGRLDAGDALLVYTDGLVEVPGRALAVGIDRLLGEAERLVPRGFSGGAERLVAAVAPAVADDRALLLLWRD